MSTKGRCYQANHWNLKANHKKLSFLPTQEFKQEFFLQRALKLIVKLNPDHAHIAQRIYTNAVTYPPLHSWLAGGRAQLK